MKITIELKSGKKLELTEDEIQEIMKLFGSQQLAPMPVYPIHPAVVTPWPVMPYITFCAPTQN